MGPGKLPQRLYVSVGERPEQWDLSGVEEWTDADAARFSSWTVIDSSRPTPRHHVYLNLSERLKPLPEGMRERVLGELAGQAGQGRAARPKHRPLTRDELVCWPPLRESDRFPHALAPVARRAGTGRTATRDYDCAPDSQVGHREAGDLFCLSIRRRAPCLGRHDVPGATRRNCGGLRQRWRQCPLRVRSAPGPARGRARLVESRIPRAVAVVGRAGTVNRGMVDAIRAIARGAGVGRGLERARRVARSFTALYPELALGRLWPSCARCTGLAGG